MMHAFVIVIETIKTYLFVTIKIVLGKTIKVTK